MFNKFPDAVDDCNNGFYISEFAAILLGMSPQPTVDNIDEFEQDLKSISFTEINISNRRENLKNYLLQ